MRKLLSKPQVRKQASKMAVKVRRKLLRSSLDEYLNSPKTNDYQRKNAELLLKHGRKIFSDEEIIEIVWGTKLLLQMLPATLWFRPRDVLDQTEALIYLVKIVTGEKCDGSKKIELNRAQEKIISFSFAEGLDSGNVHQDKERFFEECLRYARRQVKNLLNKCPELNGEKYIPQKINSRIGQGIKDSVVKDLAIQLKSGNQNKVNLSTIENRLETRRKELAQQRQWKEHLPAELYEKYFNEDGSPKKGG